MQSIFRKGTICLMLVLFVLSATLLQAQGIMNINDLAKMMKERYSKIQDYQGKIALQYGAADSGKLYEGDIFYKFPRKLKVVIKSPESRTIVADGKNLYVYYPSMNTVAVQPLNSGASVPYGQSKETLAYLFDSYSFSFSDDKGLVDFNNFKVYKIKGYPYRVESGFRMLTLYVDKTGFIVYQEGISLEGRSVRYWFTSYEVNVDLGDILFKFDMPDNVQVINNIFE